MYWAGSSPQRQAKVNHLTGAGQFAVIPPNHIKIPGPDGVKLGHGVFQLFIHFLGVTLITLGFINLMQYLQGPRCLGMKIAVGSLGFRKSGFGVLFGAPEIFYLSRPRSKT